MKRLLLLTAVTLVCGCSSSLKVYSDRDKSIDISDYRYYYWPTEAAIERKGLNPLFYNELTDKRIKTAVNDQLQRRGYIANDEKRQIEMHYHIILEDKTLMALEPSGAIYGKYWQNKSSTVYPYQEGTLIIDLMDVQTKNLVWRGWATGVVESDMTTNPEEAIGKAVAKIFKKFPYNFR